MLFILDAQYYVPVKLFRTAESIHLFKVTGKLIPEHIKLKRNILWDIIELDWKEVNVTLNRNKINLPPSVIILLRDHIMLKQGMTWFPLVSNDSPEAVEIIKDILPERPVSYQCRVISSLGS